MRVPGFATLALALALGACGGGPTRDEPPVARWTLDPSAGPAARAWWDWFHGHGDALAGTWLAAKPRRIETGPPPSASPGRPAPPDPAAAAERTLELARTRLLMSRLADERLDAPTRLRAAALAYGALPPGSAEAHLAWRWAESAAREVTDGEARLDALLGPEIARPRPPAASRHTLRISFLPYLDARRLVLAAPTQTGPDTLSALGKTWALSTTPPKPDPDGLVISLHTIPPGPAHLEIRDPGRLLAFRDGRLILATPPDRTPAGVLRFTAPGAGPLMLIWASGRVPSVTLWPAEDAAPRLPTTPTEALAAALLALEDEDREGVARWLAGAPDTVVGRLLRAEALATDPSLTAGSARDARHAAWHDALPALPHRARLELARLARQGGDLEAAHAWLAPLAEIANTAVHREAFQAHFGLGWNDEAATDLDRAERSAARPCELLDDRIALQGARGNTSGRLRMVEPLVSCGRGREAADLLLELDRPAEALARLDALPGPAADDRKVLQTRHRALVALGRLDEARALARHRAEVDHDAGAALEVADLGPATDLKAALQALVVGFPTAREARELLLAEPEAHFFAPLLQDTDAVITAYEADASANPEVYDGPAVRVLDHGATIYFPDGRRLRWVHEILAVRTREAAENFGEVDLPDGAEAVAVFNRKADGRRLYAEDMPEKDSLSVPDVAIGDYIVAAYLEPGDNGYLYDTGYLTPRIGLQNHALPAFRQRTEVFGPDDAVPDVQRLAGAPEATPVRLEALGRNGLRVALERTPVLPPEDDAVPEPLYLPSVRFGRNVTLADDLDYTRDRVLARRQRNAEFDAWAVTQAGEGTPPERAARLATAVRLRVDAQTGLIADDAPRMWASGHGHRALVLSVALEAAGIPHRLLLARPKVHVTSAPFTQIADFPYPLLALGPDFGTLIDPAPKGAPVGFFPFGFLGGDALVAWPPEAPPRVIALPTTRAVGDGRQVHLKLRWAADGTLTGEVEDTLTGQEAIVIGDYLARLDPEARPKVAERLLLPVLGAGTVTRFDDPVAGERPDGPLVLRYAFTARTTDTLSLGLFPVSPARAWAARPSRRTPMLIELPTHQRVTVELEGPPNLVTDAAPSVQVADGALAFERRVEQLEPGVYRIESRLDLEGGTIEPAAYGRFASTAQAIDPLETLGFRRTR
jgi:hypothetical protein